MTFNSRSNRATQLDLLVICFLLGVIQSACSSLPNVRYHEAGYSASAGADNQDQLKIAIVQYPLEGNQTLESVAQKMESWIQRAKKSRAQLVLFPELAVLDAWPKTSKNSDIEIIHEIAKRMTPVLFARASEWSSKYGLAVLIGSAPRVVDGKIRNTALLAFPDGRSVRQDKIFLTDWERKMGWESGESLEVVDAPWGRTAILICYDVEFPRISEKLVGAKPELILVPSMTESQSGLNRVRWAAQARAVEHHAYVVVSGTVGEPSRDWIQFGKAVALGPQDSLFESGPIGEGVENKADILYAVLDIQKLRASRKRTTFYPARDEFGK